MTGRPFQWIITLLLTLPTNSPAQKPSTAPDPVPHVVKVGEPAPDFTLLDANWKPVRLSDFRGKTDVILVFHVVAFSPHCALELRAYQRELARYRDRAPTVLGINMDSPYGNDAFAKQLGISFPLLSDTRATVLAEYGVAMRKSQVGTYAYQWPEHTTVLVDRRGIVRYVETGGAAMEPSQVFGRAASLAGNSVGNPGTR